MPRAESGSTFLRNRASTGLGASLQFHYYHPELGAEYIKRLFGDMQPTLGRDRRQITDWLAQGKICALCRLPRHGAGKKPGTAGRRARQRRLEGRSSTDFRRRVDESDQGGVQSKRGEGLYQLVSLAERADGAAKTERPVRRGSVPGALISRKMFLCRSTGWSPERYFDVSDPKYADMTPMFSLIKEIMKAREEEREASRC